MAAWYLAPSLSVMRREVDERWPEREHTSDGTIGDEAHQNTKSDHNPNSRGSVDAWDMDKDGVDVWEVIRAFQEHPSSHYWIWNREIADRDTGWQRRPYSGDNPHTAHVHFSIRQTLAAEQDTSSWGIGGDMNDTQDKRLHATNERIAGTISGKERHGTPWSEANPNGTEGNWLVQELIRQRNKLEAMDAKLTALPALIGGVDEATEARIKLRFDSIDKALVDSRQREEEMRELLSQHSDGTLPADAILRRMGELLNPPS